MKDALSQIGTRLRDYAWRSESGSITVEAVFWFPAFAILFSLIADASLVFNGQSQIQRIAQDANRAYSVGKLDSEEDTENYIKIAAGHLSGNVTAETVYDGELITTVVSFPARDLEAIGLLSTLTGVTVQIRAQHMMEL